MDSFALRLVHNCGRKETSGGISVETGFENERHIRVGNMDKMVGWEKVRIFLAAGGMLSSGSFRTVRTFFCAVFFSINFVIRLVFRSTLYGLL